MRPRAVSAPQILMRDPMSKRMEMCPESLVRLFGPLFEVGALPDDHEFNVVDSSSVGGNISLLSDDLVEDVELPRSVVQYSSKDNIYKPMQ